MQLFKGIKIEVRELPNRFGHAEHNSVVIDEPEEEIEEEIYEAEEEFEEDPIEEPVAEAVEELAEEKEVAEQRLQ